MFGSHFCQFFSRFVKQISGLGNRNLDQKSLGLIFGPEAPNIANFSQIRLVMQCNDDLRLVTCHRLPELIIRISTSGKKYSFANRHSTSHLPRTPGIRAIRCDFSDPQSQLESSRSPMISDRNHRLIFITQSDSTVGDKW